MSIPNDKITPEIVAEYFIHHANSDNSDITNKKLQKLVYYAQAWFLVLQNNKLYETPIEAWVHGPAIRSLYIKYKRFGFFPIKEKPIKPDFNKTVSSLLDSIWHIYGKMDATYLEALTHNEKPWQSARKELEAHENSENIIDTEIMEEYYNEKLSESNDV